jgi:pyrimidine oxygenase
MRLELGVFMPVGNNGWIMSANSPQYLPTYDLNSQITLLAEEIGFDYIFSMAKWRGFGGETGFWNHTVEAMTLTAGLAPLTQRATLIASIAPAIMHPAVFAKMAATLDDVCGGRLMLNVVSAANKTEYTQMGLYPENFEEYRYDYTEEWLHVCKRLWTEERVTHHGRFFDLDECMLLPHPVQKPFPAIVCATTSERGYRFVAEHCHYAFLAGNNVEATKAASLKAKAIGAEYGREVKTQTNVILVLGETEAGAQAMYQNYLAGADRAAIDNVYHLRARDKSAEKVAEMTSRYQAESNIFYGGQWFVGGPERTAAFFEDLAVNGAADGIVMTFQDFLVGLRIFGEKVMPLLRARGLDVGRADARLSA